jgi:GntR family transcriptional repressor for pyruvate dehydrogenase complex
VVLKVLDIIMDLLRDTRERSLQVEGRPQKSLAGHRRILAAIKRHDAEGAKSAMRRHIEDVEEIVLDHFLWKRIVVVKLAIRDLQCGGEANRVILSTAVTSAKR